MTVYSDNMFSDTTPWQPKLTHTHTIHTQQSTAGVLNYTVLHYTSIAPCIAARLDEQMAICHTSKATMFALG